MKSNEESKAAVLWAFIERLRKEDAAAVAGLGSLAAADLEQLARLLETAIGVRRAFDDAASEPEAAVLDRVNAAIAARQGGETTSGPSPTTLLSRLPALIRRPILAGAAVLA